LQAGIVFVDWLATCPANFVDRSNTVSRDISIAFLVLFGLTLLAQKLDWSPLNTPNTRKN
jgi:hypothetical protein